jgi:hypothetical protein
MKLPPSKASSGRYYHSAVEIDRIHDFRCRLWLDYANKLPRRMRLRKIAAEKAQARIDLLNLIIGGLMLSAMAAVITFLLFAL